MNSKTAKALRKALNHHPKNAPRYVSKKQLGAPWTLGECTRAAYQRAKRSGSYKAILGAANA